MAEMTFKYETQGTNTYLVYTIQPGDVVDTMGLGMLTNNKIAGLAQTQFSQMDTERYIMFNVSAKVPVSQFFSGPVNRKRLVGVFKGITSALISAEEYMIDANSILLEMDYIFTDVSTCETILICLPVQQDRPPVNLGQFFKGIMFSTQFDQTENCDYVAKIMNYLNSAPVFSVYDFDALMDQIQKGGSPAAYAAPQPVQQPAPQPIQQPLPQQPLPQQPAAQPAVPQPVKQKTPGQAPVNPYPQNPGFPPAQNGVPQQPAPQGFQVPGNAGPQIPQASAAQAQQPAANGKKMSYMNLLMHYNKENAALYKAQKEAEKEAKKNGQKGGAPAPMAVPNGAPMMAPAAAPEKGKKAKKEKPKTGAAAPGFAVPGQQPNAGFAVPGQNAAPAPAAGRGPSIPQPVNNSQPGYQPIPQPKPQPAPQPGFQQPAAQPAIQQPVRQPVQQPMSQPMPQSNPMGQMNFGETTVLGGGGAIGETTVLGSVQQQDQPKPHLFRVKNNERIMVNKPVYRIGKERSYVDYFVADNPAISRSHANIITRDGNYYIMDTNSTNHTYIDGAMIQSNAEIKLSHGTKIRLANEEFEFRLY